jgi:hypothetical protein
MDRTKQFNDICAAGNKDEIHAFYHAYRPYIKDIEEVCSMKYNHATLYMLEHGDLLRATRELAGYTACLNGDLGFVIYLIEHDCIPSYNWNGGLHAACRAHHMHIIDYLMVYVGHTINWLNVIDGAVLGGHIDLIKLYYDRAALKPKTLSRLIEHACRSGSIEVFEYILARADPIEDWSLPFADACASGSIDMIAHIMPRIRNDLDALRSGIIYAAYRGGIPAVTYILNCLPPSERSVVRLDILMLDIRPPRMMWVCEQGPDWNAMVIHAALHYKNDVLQFIFAHAPRLDLDCIMCGYIRRIEHAVTIRLLYDNGLGVHVLYFEQLCRLVESGIPIAALTKNLDPNSEHMSMLRALEVRQRELAAHLLIYIPSVLVDITMSYVMYSAETAA